MNFIRTCSLTAGALLGSAPLLLAQPTTAQFSAPALTAQAEVAPSATIVDVAASSDSFDTLVQAVQTAGLAEVLAGDGPFTVFAPTDDAFTALPSGAVEALLQPENRNLLVDILTYHVVSGEVPAAAVTSGAVPTLSEDALSVTMGETITVDSATVIQPDVTASNGIIHVIDAVLVPDSANAELQALLQPAPASPPTPAPAPTPEPAPVRGLW